MLGEVNWGEIFSLSPIPTPPLPLNSVIHWDLTTSHLPLRVAKAGIEIIWTRKITPLLPTGIGELYSQI